MQNAKCPNPVKDIGLAANFVSPVGFLKRLCLINVPKKQATASTYCTNYNMNLFIVDSIDMQNSLFALLNSNMGTSIENEYYINGRNDGTSWYSVNSSNKKVALWSGTTFVNTDQSVNETLITSCYPAPCTSYKIEGRAAGGTFPFICESPTK